MGRHNYRVAKPINLAAVQREAERLPLLARVAITELCAEIEWLREQVEHLQREERKTTKKQREADFEEIRRYL